ncbi:MAG: phosphosulfolactate synthase [Bacteroidales bacterium]
MTLPLLPHRESKPRNKGVAMMMDKGLSLQEARNIVEVAGHLIDFAKLGFGTSVVSNNVAEKVKIYRDAGIKVYVGGTLFEAFLIRNDFEGYVKYIEKLGVDAVEISDGSMYMQHTEKCGYISHFAKNYTVLSEVGAKDSSVAVDHIQWIHHMNTELDAGSSLVIGEARESGTVGLYDKSGSADVALIQDILREVPSHKIMWEAPLKPQQVWFIKLLGHDVNLGNIAPADIIPLETLRLGLRGDTFFDFLPQEYQQFKL